MCSVTAVPADASDDLTSTPLSSDSSTYEDLKFIERVIEVTRCRDRHLVSAVCAEAGYFDLDLVCSHVLAFMDGVRSSSGSTTSTSDGEHATDSAPSNKPAAAVGGAKAKSRGTRRQRKQEKKARAVQRRQANTAVATAAAAGGAGCHGRLGSCSDEDDASPFVISQQLKVLQI